MAELETGKRTSENKQEKSRFREEQTKEQTCYSDTDREQGHRERKKHWEGIWRAFRRTEYEVEMRIPQKKEQLLDLNLQLFRRKLNIDE